MKVPTFAFILLTMFQRKRDNGWSFVVTLSRIVQKKGIGQERESVRLEPHPPYIRPTAIEARHWGATYALVLQQLHHLANVY